MKEGDKCPVCEKDRLFKVFRDFSISLNVNVKGVPRLVCDLCNEAFFEDDVAKMVAEVFVSVRRVLGDDREEKRKTAKTVAEKEKYNVWDNYAKDVFPVLLDVTNGRWSWTKNQECKYIEVRIDMRDLSCIIRNRYRKRINPENLAFQQGKDK